jgi:hypothetical protein
MLQRAVSLLQFWIKFSFKLIFVIRLMYEAKILTLLAADQQTPMLTLLMGFILTLLVFHHSFLLE